MRRRGFLAAGIGVTALSAAAARGLLRRFEIVNESMQPALNGGDWVIAQRRRRAPKRGEVVVFEHEDRPGMTLVKRVIGLPDERLAISSGQIYIDGMALAEPWVNGFTAPDGVWDIPADCVFVLGDFRAISAADSRAVGPIPLRDVQWKVAARYWPSSAAGLVSVD